MNFRTIYLVHFGPSTQLVFRLKPLRHTPPDTTWFVGNRCFQAQFLLRPDEDTQKLFAYWLARSLRVHPGVELIAAVQMSNHYHLVVKDRDSELSRFLRYFQAHLATAINKLRNRNGRVFQERFFASVILDEESIRDRIVYTGMNPIKAWLVRSPEDWPGVIILPKNKPQTIEANIFDHDKKKQDEKAGIKRLESAYIRTESMQVAPRADAQAIEDEMRASCLAHQKNNKSRNVLGVRKLRKQDPFSSPQTPKKSRRPSCHTVCEKLKQEFLSLRRNIRSAHAHASVAFRSGRTDISFPTHTFCSFRFCPS